MRTRAIYLTIAALLFTIVPSVHGELIGGIEFPDGNLSFADAVHFYDPGPDVAANYNAPLAALGRPDYSGNNFTAASLGEDGVLVLRFVDNSLTTSGDNAPDLHIFEVGGVTEWFNAAISTDASNWIDLGDVKGQPTSIDIDAVSGVTAGTKYSYVKLTDIFPSQTDSPYGEADIDAVGAISSAPPAVPVPGAVLLGMLGLSVAGAQLRKRA